MQDDISLTTPLRRSAKPTFPLLLAVALLVAALGAVGCLTLLASTPSRADGMELVSATWEPGPTPTAVMVVRAWRADGKVVHGRIGLWPQKQRFSNMGIKYSMAQEGRTSVTTCRMTLTPTPQSSTPFQVSAFTPRPTGLAAVFAAVQSSLSGKPMSYRVPVPIGSFTLPPPPDKK